jgi:hypothetical protein
MRTFLLMRLRRWGLSVVKNNGREPGTSMGQERI